MHILFLQFDGSTNMTSQLYIFILMVFNDVSANYWIVYAKKMILLKGNTHSKDLISSIL